MKSGLKKGLRILPLLTTLSFLFSLHLDMALAHDHGASKIHEVQKNEVPTISLDVKKDPTGGFNVEVITTNFQWTPENASATHIEGQGHAHVYLAGQKIIRLYNNWFHLNTYQFATTPGEQLLRVELVGNDHAPITANAMQISSELLVDVPTDETRPREPNTWKRVAIGVGSAALILLGLLLSRIRKKNSSEV